MATYHFIAAYATDDKDLGTKHLEIVIPHRHDRITVWQKAARAAEEHRLVEFAGVLGAKLDTLTFDYETN